MILEHVFFFGEAAAVLVGEDVGAYLLLLLFLPFLVNAPFLVLVDLVKLSAHFQVSIELQLNFKGSPFFDNLHQLIKLFVFFP